MSSNRTMAPRGSRMARQNSPLRAANCDIAHGQRGKHGLT
jgi:hypothetical protein